MKPSKLLERQPISDRATAPSTLSQRQNITSAYNVAKIKTDLKQIGREYQSTSENLKTYEELVVGVNEEFEVDPNYLIDLEAKQSVEQEIERTINPLSDKISDKLNVIGRKQAILERKGVYVDTTNIKRDYEALKGFQDYSKTERQKIISNVYQEQQNKLKQFSSLVSSAPTPLAQRQEALFQLASENLDLVSTPYVYDEWKKEKELKEGVTALGYDYSKYKPLYEKAKQGNLTEVDGYKVSYNEKGAITSLTSGDGKQVLFYDSGSLKQIIAAPKSYVAYSNRNSGDRRQTFIPYIISFDVTGNLVSEKQFDFGKDTQWDRGKNYYTAMQVYEKFNVDYSDGKPVAQIQRDVMRVRRESGKNYQESDYKIYTKESVAFNEGIIQKSAVWQPYTISEQRVRYDGYTEAIDRFGVSQIADKDFAKGEITQTPTPGTRRSVSNAYYDIFNPEKTPNAQKPQNLFVWKIINPKTGQKEKQYLGNFKLTY